MVLASLAKAKKEIISEKLNVLRNIGLSSAGRVITLSSQALPYAIIFIFIF